MLRLIAFVLLVVGGSMAMSYAQPPEEQQACQNDAFRLCQQLVPDRERVFECLVQNRELLNGICRGAIDRASPPPPPPVATKGKAKAKTPAKTPAKKKAGPGGA